MKQIDLQKKIREKFIKQGVKMINPNTVYFSKDTKIGKNVTIEPFVVIGSKVKIKDNVKILSFSHIEGVVINENVSVGPFCRLRPGTILEKNSKIGNFVEVKKRPTVSRPFLKIIKYFRNAIYSLNKKWRNYQTNNGHNIN